MRLAACLVACLVAASFPDDDDATVRGKKASEWLEMWRSDPKAERRQAALVALGLLGPKPCAAWSRGWPRRSRTPTPTSAGALRSPSLKWGRTPRTRSRTWRTRCYRIRPRRPRGLRPAHSADSDQEPRLPCRH